MDLELANYISTYHSQLDNIYIDKFWSSINNKQWLYADDMLIEWIGYKKDNGKFKYTNLIRENFKEGVDYKTYNYEKLNEIFHSPLRENENNKEILGFKNKLKEVHNRTIHLIISPKCFKKSLMMIRTEKANSIREYYIDIEEVCLDFNKFLLEQSKLNLENKDNELKNNDEKLEKEINKNKVLQFKIINNSILNSIEFIYIITNNRYSLESIFKIGRATNLISRKSTYNTGLADSDKYYYVYIFKCHNAKALESVIFSLLKGFRIKNEMYQIHFEALCKIFDFVCNNDKNNLNMINDFVSNEYAKYLDKEITIHTEVTELNPNVIPNNHKRQQNITSNPNMIKNLNTPSPILFINELLEETYVHRDFDIKLNKYIIQSANFYKIYLDYCKSKKIHYETNKIFMRKLKLISLSTNKLQINKKRHWAYRFNIQEVQTNINYYFNQ